MSATATPLKFFLCRNFHSTAGVPKYCILVKIPSSMISLIVFIACFTAANACSCQRRELKDAFCNSDIVTMARVESIDKSDTSIGGAVNYGIWHLRTWKGLDKVNVTSVLTTSNSIDACGKIDLEQDMDYVLTGKLKDNGEISFTSCDFVNRWSEVTGSEMDLLRDLREGTKKCQSS
ncbi:tissue inhibitor of metalloproteinase [Ancylostoma ceylanicum]|nr:tissue inhibitor of metalloproteinase [Ancylostoma ceylanicum]EYC37090.1 hypothetical protein Y032_0828g2564 [Ancylostoma ceylanicum]